MPEQQGRIARIRQCLRRMDWARILPWALSAVSISYAIILFLIPGAMPDRASEMSEDIGLMTQILAIVLGLSVIGVTVSLSSFDLADDLQQLSSQLGRVFSDLRDRFFQPGCRGGKVTNSGFGEYLFRRTGIETLLFRGPHDNEEQQRFVLRPYWDGAWYPTGGARYAGEGIRQSQLQCIAKTHEVVICASMALKLVGEFRGSGCALLSEQEGSQGTRWFLGDIKNELGNSESLFRGMLDNGLSLAQGQLRLRLALHSFHYMDEELRSHSENINWNPFEISRSQVIMADYVIWMVYTLVKLQTLRLATVADRSTNKRARMPEVPKEKIAFDALSKMRADLFDIKRSAASVHGLIQNASRLKKASVPGLGISGAALLAIVILWPIRSVVGGSGIALLYAGLYAGGLAGILHGVLFMALVVCGSRRPLLRSPLGANE